MSAARVGDDEVEIAARCFQIGEDAVWVGGFVGPQFLKTIGWCAACGVNGRGAAVVARATDEELQIGGRAIEEAFGAALAFVGENNAEVAAAQSRESSRCVGQGIAKIADAREQIRWFAAAEVDVSDVGGAVCLVVADGVKVDTRDGDLLVGGVEIGTTVVNSEGIIGIRQAIKDA